MNYQKKILNKKVIGKNIRLLVEKSTYTYEDIAEFLQLTSPRVIYEWVNGTKLPCFENIVNISLIFDTDIERIIAFL